MLSEDPSPSPAAAPSRARFVTTWFNRLSPWVSLVTSVWSALYMDRHEDMSPWIVAFAALSFVGLSAATVAHRPRAAPTSVKVAHLHTLLRFTTLTASQSLTQGALLFSAPFYVQASAFTVGQCLFLGVLGACIAVSLWDPWTERYLLHPLAGPALLAFSSFAAWNVALPMLGVAHEKAIWIAALAVSVCVPAVVYVAGAGKAQKLENLLGGAVIPIALAAFGVTLLPAAPLKIVELGIGTEVRDRTLVGATTQLEKAPETLYCLSAIFEPQALDEGLFHVWTRDGDALFRIPLAVHGGRKRGFRTWSRLPLGGHGRGVYRCEVTTGRGQTLGVATLHIGPR